MMQNLHVRDLIKWNHYLELSRLDLRVLDVSMNELNELPCELRCMSSLIDLHIDGNPLNTPPANLCSKVS